MPTRLLLPIALAQGLWVRQTVPRLPPAAGCRGTFGAGSGDPLRVVGVGDSIIAGVGVAHQDRALLGHFARRLHERTGRPVRWRACGVNGADSTMIRERIAPAAPAADNYIISAGVNDAVLGARAARLQEAARAAAPGMHAICFDFPADLPPGGFARDGFHPAEAACEAWAGWLLETWLNRTSHPAWLDCESASLPA